MGLLGQNKLKDIFIQVFVSVVMKRVIQAVVLALMVAIATILGTEIDDKFLRQIDKMFFEEETSESVPIPLNELFGD